MTSKWLSPMTKTELDAQYALTASIDPAFAARDRQFWETRTANQLRNLKYGAWQANEADTYQRASTYLFLMGEAA